MDLLKKQLDWEQRKIDFYQELDQMTIALNDPNVNYKSYIVEGPYGMLRLTYQDRIIKKVYAKHFFLGGSE